MDQIELFLTVYKRLMLDWIVSFTLQYLKTFNCVQVKQSVFDSNTWNHLIMWKQIIHIR